MPARSAATSGRIIACERKTRDHDPHFKRNSDHFISGNLWPERVWSAYHLRKTESTLRPYVRVGSGSDVRRQCLPRPELGVNRKKSGAKQNSVSKCPKLREFRTKIGRGRRVRV